MNTNLEKQLFRAGFIVVPLKQNETLGTIQPNFLVIENIFDFYENSTELPDLPNIDTSLCINAIMKLVYREILPEQFGRQSEIREVVIDNIGSRHLPLDVLPLVCTHSRMKSNKDLVNGLLSLFEFRGALEGYTMVYDDTVSQVYIDIITQELADKKAEEDKVAQAALQALENQAKAVKTQQDAIKKQQDDLRRQQEELEKQLIVETPVVPEPQPVVSDEEQPA